MRNRPKLQLPLSRWDKTAEVAAWTIVAGAWLIVLFNYNKLPDIIPMHYNASGEIDGYGDKSGIFLVLSITTVLIIGLSVLNKFPHIFNYSKKITLENAQSQYVAATRMIRYLKLAIAVTFLITTFTTVRAAYSGVTFVGNLLLPIITGLVMIPILYFFMKMNKRQ